VFATVDATTKACRRSGSLRNKASIQTCGTRRFAALAKVVTSNSASRVVTVLSL